VQDSIELILKQKIGLDPNSVGSRIIARALEQRQAACHLADQAEYLKLVKSSPQELNQLIEAVVVPETWFFRDQGAFEVLRNDAQQNHQTQIRILSVPCSTGEEPYSIAMTLLEVGLTPNQFQIDAVDISEHALAKAKKAIYRQHSFRGKSMPNLERYFQQIGDRYQVLPEVRRSVNFIQGNILEPHFLNAKQYHVIFCRNLLIYLDHSARQRTLDILDQALLPMGLLFLGSVETPQLTNRAYQLVEHSAAFAFRKQELKKAPSIESKLAPKKQATSVQSPHLSPLAPQTFLAESTLIPLETAQDLADRGQLVPAAELCESYIRTHPSQASAYLLLGKIYQGLNQMKQAEQSFHKAIYLNPENYEALIYLALLKEQQGNQIEANRLRKRAQRLIPSSSQSGNLL
jgi:chemotaxis protein methyltransferase WspC